MGSANARDWTNRLAWLSLGSFTVLWLAQWPAFPLVLDPAYHLLIARQVSAAGGPIAYEWWEFAPGGRPHLYPPVLHLLLATILKLGGSPLFAIRLVSVALLPGLLLSIWLAMRRLFTPWSPPGKPVARVEGLMALACLWMAMMPVVFHVQSALTLAATIGLIELLWLMEAIAQRRIMAAGLLFALLCYTHLGLPWIALAIMGCYGILQPDARRDLIRACWGLCLALPWWWHLLRHRAFLHAIPRVENTMAEFMPLLWILALIGAWRCWRLKGRYAWLLACWAGFALLIPRHVYRWHSGEGLLPMVLLAGVGAEWVAQRMARSRHLLVLLAVVCVVAFSPTLSRTQTGSRWLWPDSGPAHLLGVPGVTSRQLGFALQSGPMDDVIRSVERLTQPNEILWSNLPYAAGWIAAITRRATSSGMVDEVSPAVRADPIRAAQVVIWFKVAPLPGGQTFAQLQRYALRRVAENEMAIIFRNPQAAKTASAPRAVMPWGLAVALLSLALILVVRDFRRRHSNG